MGCEQFFADVSSKIIALADPVLSQPDMEWEMVSPPAGVYSLIHDLQRIAGPSCTRILGRETLPYPAKAYVMVRGCGEGLFASTSMTSCAVVQGTRSSNYTRYKYLVLRFW